jgi:small-conductance mechanosensitive channel
MQPVAFFLLVIQLFLQSSQEVPPGSPVVLGNRTLFRIQWGFKTFTPDLRARGVSERLERLAEDPTRDFSTSVVPAGMTVDLVAGQETLVSVFPGDAEIAGTSQQALAEHWASIIRDSVRQYREEHRRGSFLMGLGLTVLTLALYGLSVFGLYRLCAAIRDRMVHRVRTRVSGRPVISALEPNYLQTAVWRAIRFVHLIVSLALLYLVFELILSYFPQTRFISRQLAHDVLNPLRKFAVSFWNSLPSLVFVGLVAWSTIHAVRFTRFVFRKILNGEIRIEGFRSSWAGPTQRIVSFLIVVLAVLIVYPYIPGSDSPAFKGVTIFLGVLFSFGSTGVVSNLVTGILLTYMDVFQAGDLVRVGDTVGVVKRTSLLVTRIEDRHHQIISIPNSVVLASQVTNYTAFAIQGTVMSSKISVGYDVSWRQVEGCLQLAASRTRGVRKDPAPYVLLLSLDQFFITYELLAHVEPAFTVYFAKSELNSNILDACNEYGIQIMTPTYESDREFPAVVPKDKWYSPPARRSDTDAA